MAWGVLKDKCPENEWISHEGWRAACEEAYPEELLLRLDQPAPGVAHLFAMPMGGQVLLSVRLFLYGKQASAIAAQVEPAWQAWVNQHFSAPGAPGAA